jgi:hypothetical protein
MHSIWKLCPILALIGLVACGGKADEKKRYQAFLLITASTGEEKKFSLGTERSLSSCIDLVAFEVKESADRGMKFFTNAADDYGSSVKSKGFVNEYTVTGAGCQYDQKTGL